MGTQTRRAALAVIAVLSALLGPAAREASAAIDWSKAERVMIITVEYRFVPDRLAFKRGVPYRLHLRNEGKELHEFTAPEFFRSLELGNPEALAGNDTEVVLQPGRSTDVLFVPRQAGRYPLTCADHDWAGMIGEIVVE